MRERLIELISRLEQEYRAYREDCLETDLLMVSFEDMLADYLLSEGVIVPPCKVGDTVYKVCTVNSRIKFGDMWDGKVVKRNCDRCGYRCAYCYNIGLQKHEHEFMIDVIVEKQVPSLLFLVDIMPYFGKIWFTTKEEAEKALAERENKR